MALGDTAKLIASLELQDKFSRPAAGITRSLGGLEKGFGNIGRGAGQVAGGIDRLATRAALAAAGGLTAVVTTAASFEQAFTGVEKTVDGTAAQLAELEGVFRQMARTIPVSFEELSAIGEAGGALGIARDDLDEFTDVVARLAVSTNLTSESAATALGGLGTTLHLAGKDFEDFADSLVALGNAGASTEAEIIEIANRFAAAGNSAGLTKEEILALASATASMRIPVEAAGSSLSRVFNSVATNIGTSSKKAVAFADTLGLSAKEFKAAWEKDALGTFQDFLKELSKMDQFAQANVLKKIGITGVRDINAVKLMSQNLGFFNDQLEISRNATGALDKESQKFFDTTQGRWKVTVANVRDVANTIGAELLPIVNDLTKEFVDFLQLDSTQAGIKTFAKDLATGVRSLVTELKGTDFSGIIGGMKLAASVAKGAFDAFRSLPQPIQQLAIAALVANKVSGGAIGQIAGGLGSILKGTIQLAFPKLDIFSRGSPVNPMFVRVAGGIPGTGVGAGGITSGSKGFWSGVGKVFGLAAVGVIGVELGSFIGKELFFNPTVKPAMEFETTEFDAFLKREATNREDLIKGLKVLEDALFQLAGDTVDIVDKAMFGEQIDLLEQQIALTKEAIANAPIPPPLGPPAPIKAEIINPDDIGGPAFRAAVEARRVQQRGFEQMTLELRLLKDKTFKQQIGGAEFIRLLRKTSEFGRKGEGTTIEQGPTTGRDRFGDAFVALVKRVKNPLTPEVFREISNHIIALEEVQSSFIKDGNIKAANHAQRNINELHRVIGSQDQTKTEIRRARIDANQRTAANTAKLESVNTNLTRQRGIAQDALGVQRGILAKPSSLTANVNVTTNVSVNNVLRTITSAYIAAGKGAAGLNM